MACKQITLTDYFYDKTASDGRYVQKESGKGLSSNDYTTAEKTKLSGIETGATKTTIDSSLSSSSTNPVQNKVINSALGTKANSSDLKTVATSGSYNDLTNKPNIAISTSELINDGEDGTHEFLTTETTPSNIGADVTVVQQASAETGYTATYVVKQGGSQVGTKINIPKDFLVRSATIGTSTANNSPQAGFTKGDKYLDFVINTKDSSATAEHLYVNVKDLFNEYDGDGTTIELNNNVFSLKSGINVSTFTNDAGYFTSSDIGGSSNTSASKIVACNDTRLSDSRTPKSHSHGSLADGGTLNSDISTVNKIAVTDSSNNLKTISQLPYSKISGTPTIPTKVSDLTNDSGFITNGGIDVEELEDLIDLSYDSSTGKLTLCIGNNNSN